MSTNNQSSVDLFVSEDSLTSSHRRSDLAMEFLSIMSDHETGKGDEYDAAEAINVLMTTTAFLCTEFGIPELKLLSEMRNLHRKCTIARDRLGPRGTARDTFAELAVMEEDKPAPVKAPVKKKAKK